MGSTENKCNSVTVFSQLKIAIAALAGGFSVPSNSVNNQKYHILLNISDLDNYFSNQ